MEKNDETIGMKLLRALTKIKTIITKCFNFIKRVFSRVAQPFKYGAIILMAYLFGMFMIVFSIMNMGRLAVVFSKVVIHDEVAWLNFLGTFFGSLIGASIAVWGAWWVSKRLEGDKEKKALEKNAFIIYHDLFWGLIELRKFIVCNIHPEIEEKISVFLSEDFKDRVASLSDFLTTTELFEVYFLYHLIVELKEFNDLSQCDMSKQKYMFDRIYSEGIFSARFIEVAESNYGFSQDLNSLGDNDLSYRYRKILKKLKSVSTKTDFEEL